MNRLLLASVVLLQLVGTAVADPVLRVAVLGDVQGYPYPEDAGMRNLERALDMLAPLKPSVVLTIGDINDSGRDVDAVKYYKSRCDARLGKVAHVACLGNHELDFVPPELRSMRTAARCTADFNAVFGEGPDPLVHKTIGGYDFIALSISRPEGFVGEDLPPLKAALEKAVRRDAEKPIFVLTHFHPLNTVNCSSNAREDGGLRALLDAYPQVVNLSGHTHNPLRDPRSIWQGSFTVLDTSTLCYGCIDNHPPMSNQISCLIPYGHESVGCMLLEIYPKRLVIRRFSVRERREIGKDDPWSFSLPYNPKRPKYGFATRAESFPLPRFDGDAEPTLWYDFGFVYLLFNAVVDPEDVFCYRFELVDQDGKKTGYSMLSDYYRAPSLRVPRVCSRIPPNVVRSGGKYRCRIVPVGFFGREGRACEWSFEIRPNYPVSKLKPNCMQE